MSSRPTPRRRGGSPTNQRNSRLYRICSISTHSDRTSYNTYNSNADSTAPAGSTDALPSRTAYGNPCPATIKSPAPASAQTAGTRSSGSCTKNRASYSSKLPRIGHLHVQRITLSPRLREVFQRTARRLSDYPQSKDGGSLGTTSKIWGKSLLGNKMSR